MKTDIIDGVLLKKALAGSVKLLEMNKEEINSLNVFPVPDGDTGTNMALTIKSALKQAQTVEENNASKVALAASQGSLMGARGNSGVILSQLFRGFADGLNNKETIDVKALAEGLKQASDTAYKAVMKPTEGTILTVARECGEYAMAIAKEETDVLKFLRRVMDHGNMALDKTPDMLPVLKQAGVVDAGGRGFMDVLLGAYSVMSGEDLVGEPIEVVKQDIVHTEYIDSEDIKYGYCTEFMINTDSEDIDKFRSELAIQGDSLMVVGDQGLVKVHIHTNNPGAVIEKALLLGELNDIKIDNMRFQHKEVLLKDELKSLEKEEKELITKKYSFVAVSIGEGIDEVFKGLNVDSIVPGGQTMNPSTEDILNAINKTSGEHVFILPNNGNIILAAEQAKELSTRNIIVLPTRSVPEGISALLAFNEDASLEENREMMNENISNVLTGQVTYAVRDTEFNDSIINKDDIIGLFHSDIRITGNDINDVATKLVGDMINDDISIISIFYGNDIQMDIVEELENTLEEIYPDIDVEVIFGGQPLYYYIFSLE